MAAVILFELNEVPRRLFEHTVARRPDSALARLWAGSARWETVSQDEGHLSPWVTWPTVHRGVTNTRHLIHDFGQPSDQAAAFPPVWSLVAASGSRRAGVFGSLHSYPPPARPEGYAFYVPDLFAPEPTCHPASLEPFQALMLRLSRESARNVDAAVPWREAARLGASLPRLGLRPATVAGLARQLADERRARWKVVRRRSWQAVLAFDAYLRLLRRHRPDFSTFFANHVASAMHRYWAAAFPGDYDEHAYDDDWRERYRGEIDFAMDRTDAMVARLLDHVERHPGTILVVATSMGQAATTSQPVETQVHVGDAARLLATLGVPPGGFEVRPAMFPQFNVAVAEPWRSGLREALPSLRVNGQAVVAREGDDGFFSLDFGQANVAEPSLEWRGAPVPFESSGLRNVEIHDKSGTSAYHVAEGVLLACGALESGGRPGDRGTVPTTDIAPSILAALGVGVPAYMSRAELWGTSPVGRAPAAR